MKKPELSGDIFIKRENWNSGYHIVARQKGRFVHSEKWHGKQSSEKVVEKITKGSVADEGKEYKYLFIGENEHGQPRHLSVTSNINIRLGSKRKSRLYTSHLKKHAIEKYSSDRRSPTPGKFKNLRLKSAYLFGLKIA